VNDSLDGVAKATDTFVGAALGETKLRRFLVGLNGSEITGLTESPEARQFFCEHPEFWWGHRCARHRPRLHPHQQLARQPRLWHRHPASPFGHPRDPPHRRWRDRPLTAA
jgi:hypothetical protein